MTKTKTLEERTAAHAHSIWVEEGKPEGQAERHWEMARELVAQEDNVGVTLLPIDAHKSVVVEPIEAIANQADFPELTDQTEPPALAIDGKRRSRKKGNSA